MNKVVLLGNLTRDVELKQTPSGTAVAQLGLAMNRKWKDAQGEKREEVTFVDCEAWGKTAEIIAQYFGKGRQILVEGRLKLDQWEDKDSGAKRSKLKVVIEQFYFLQTGDKLAEGDSPKPASGKGRATDPIDDDSIPF